MPISPAQGPASPKVLETIFFYGDALAEERARNVQWMFRDGDCEVDLLEGWVPSIQIGMPRLNYMR